MFFLVYGIGNGFIGVLATFQRLNIARISLSLNFKEQFGAVALKEGMPELDVFRRTLALVEVVHVQLADERVDVAVFEVRWKRLVYKSFFARDVEA